MTSKEMLSKIEGLLPKPYCTEKTIITLGRIEEGKEKPMNRRQGLTISFWQHEHSREEIREVFERVRKALPDLDRAAFEEVMDMEWEYRITIESH